MKLEELIGSLRIFEMDLKEDKNRSKKMVAFQVESQQADGDEGDDLTKSMVFLTKKTSTQWLGR